MQPKFDWPGGKRFFFGAVLVLSLAFALHSHAQDTAPSLKPGNPAPPLGLEVLLQAPANAKTSWDALKGNVVVLEFWATWCGPCRTAMPHLNELAEKYKGKPVRFISITDEEEWRVHNFLKVTPIKGWIGLDADRSSLKAFGVGIIPHTVLVDREGKVAGVVQPSDVSAELLDRMLAGLPARPASVQTAGPAPAPAPVQAATDTTPLLVEISIKPSNPSISMSFSGDSFKAKGMALKKIISIAWDVPPVRVLSTGPAGDETYAVTARVPGNRSAELRPLLRQALSAALGVSVRREMRELDVLILSKRENGKSALRPAKSGQEGWARSDDGQISGNAISFKTFCGVLEDMLGRVVLDETDLNGFFDIALYWDPRSPDSVLKEIRDQVGLELRPEKRSIEILVFEVKI